MNASVERVRDALAELIKAALVSDDGRSLQYRESARAALTVLAADPPDPGGLRMDGAWTLAVQAAEAPELQPEEGRVSLTLPRQCPFTLDEILAESFDVDAAVERIAERAATG
ncbi:hypothetical protein [Methylobacterium radiodurans]|uniref:Uncharacterized protein n=1 Tax=Methylobacterium radiodurans TaxID=2202828 RepID=A0A2U8VNV3_9HYPH|nr:hypothetical protein [Methylobacterium radiodurans]AWN35285.1 hypothetical protein DK427_05665 [Methylobacterium radiodurans]